VIIAIFACSLFGVFFNRRKKVRIVEQLTEEYKGKQLEEKLKKDENMMMVNFWIMILTFTAGISGVILLVNIIR
jgi:hypothetical protein